MKEGEFGEPQVMFTTLGMKGLNDIDNQKERTWWKYCLRYWCQSTSCHGYVLFEGFKLKDIQASGHVTQQKR